MKIYIASSWKHQHAVQMLTKLLRESSHEVISFVEDGLKRNFTQLPFEDWLKTKDADEAFYHDSTGAMNCKIFIYIGPSGKDAAAECGMAYASSLHHPIYMIALWAKGEDIGITRKMFNVWCFSYEQVLAEVKNYSSINICTKDPNTCRLEFCDFSKCLTDDKESKFTQTSLDL